MEIKLPRNAKRIVYIGRCGTTQNQTIVDNKFLLLKFLAIGNGRQIIKIITHHSIAICGHSYYYSALQWKSYLVCGGYVF